MSSKRKDSEVLVIGAGMAGLTAAAELENAGVQVRLLEARPRLGGRIWTSRRWSEIPMDLGASWIHGLQAWEPSGDPLSCWAKELGIQTTVTDYDNAVIHDVDGQPLTSIAEDFLSDVTFRLDQAIEEDMERLHGEEGGHGSIFDALAQRVDPEGLTSEQRRWFHAAIGQYVHEYGEDLEKIDRCTGFLADTDFSGRDVLFPGGFDQLVERLATGLEAVVNCQVRRLSLSASGVEASTAQGSFSANQAIVTLPLGVLKAGTVEFQPPLPAAKLEAIGALGFGLLNKCCLRFPSVFWDPAYEIIGHVDAAPGRWLEFLNMRVYTGEPVLVGFNGGSFGREIEGWSDQQVVESAMKVLRGIYGVGIPSPVDWQITRWSSDPYALGAYSHHAVGSGPEHREALARPIENRLFFAGEATAQAFYPSVHGAVLSGERAARDLLAAREVFSPGANSP